MSSRELSVEMEPGTSAGGSRRSVTTALRLSASYPDKE